MRCFIVLAVISVAAAPVAARQGTASPQFEVASIKPNTAGTGNSIRRLPDGTFIATNASIRSLLQLAYRSEDDQYRNLPDWASRDRFDITVKPPADVRGDTTEMWRQLFRERMQLAAHFETADTPIYLLERVHQDRLGPQMKESPRDCAAESAAAQSAGPPREPARFPTEDDIMNSCRILFSGGRVISGGVRLQGFLPSLNSMVGRPIEDHTGLTGYYAFTLTYSAARASAAQNTASDPSAPPDIVTALREQLGLELKPSRKPMQTVVIDHIQRPSEN